MKLFSEAKSTLVKIIVIYASLKLLFLTGWVSPYIQQIIIYATIVMIAAQGLNVIYGYTGQFSLGHAAFYGIGGYVSAFITKSLSIDGSLYFIPIVIISGLVSGACACLIGIPILRLKEDFLAIATLGFGTLVRVLLDNSDRVIEVLGGSRGFSGIPKLTTLEISFFFATVLHIMTRNLVSSSYGLFLKSIKEDELASLSLGINTPRMKLLAFTYGCFLAGCGGALYANLYCFLHPSNFDILRSIDFLMIVIIGGMGSINGTVYVSLLWVGFIEGLRIILPDEVLELRWVFIPIFLILIMMFRPQGILGKKYG
ncbi:MAG: branched-chain amino acid ABC transporter permease [Desulfobacterota bacterium]|nr:branched-chain amino acid ABC transporter permease [Thermodesulfobacteriota bacterium]MDW8001321.1 branched-chain amino acid ABC transporter permease [Deltaproteobacteria bacterium]